MGSAARSKTAVSRFLTEAQSIAALNHPNIVQIHDYGRATDGPFLIMEFVEGNSLLDKCREGALPLEEAVDLTCQLCDGLSKAHAANIVHRDIKPANVLLTEDGIPKLTDFGLAKDEAADTGMTVAGAVLGTLDFMSPEQRKDAALTDARSDLWSLAATLYQMVTGESPKIIRIKKVPTQLQDLIDKALEEAKDDRYQTALELKDALRQALQGGADADAELDQGECPHCGTKNDVSRKFCRNADCGGSLEVPCLSCTTGIPMWEAVCGSCGAKQELLIAERREEMASQKTEAEACVANHKYDQAIRLMTSVEKVKDLRLQQLTGWAATFKDRLQAERERAVESAGKRLLEAKEHELAADYPAAIKSLEQVPESLRGRTLENQSVAVGAFLSQLRRKQQQIQNLEQQLRNRVKAKQLTGLLKEVESLLRLVPNHGDALKLKEQLLAREEKLKRLSEKAYAEAVSHFESQNYNETLSALSRIEESQVNSAVEELRDQTETVLNTLVSLNKNIKEKLASKEYSDLEDLVDHFLILKADDREKKRLKEQLVERDGARKRAGEEGFADAQEQVKQHEYKSALASLGKIPRALADPQVRELRDQIKDTVAEIDQLDREIERLSGTGEATTLRRRLKEYLALQPNDGERQQLLAQLIEEEQKAQELADNALSRAQELVSQFQFEDALTQLAAIPEARLTDESRALTGTCSKLKTLREKALYEFQKSLRFHTYEKAIDAARAYQSDAQVLLTHKDAEFQNLRKQCLKSQQAHEEESNRLAEKQALKKKLMMTASLAAILAMVVGGVLWVNTMKEQKAEALGNALESRDYQTVLQLDPGNAAGLAMKKAADLQQALASGDYTAALELDPGNAVALSMKKKAADIKESLSAGDYSAGLQLDPSNAVALSMKKTADIRQALSDGDYAAALQLDPSNAVALSMKKKAVDIQQALSDGDYAAALQLDPSNAEGLSMKKTADIQQALSDGDYAAGLRLDPSNAQARERVSNLPPITNSIGMQLKLIPTGTFTMGDANGDSDETPHQVTLTKPFMLGVYEVTQSQYEQVMGNNPSKFKGADNPVEQVSWDAAVEFCRKLSSLPAEKAAGNVYRLPSEAEWEYACRAGTTTQYSFGDDESDLGQYAWYDGNSGRKVHPVGDKQPNAWGLYDMHGNVYEWCQDRFGDYRSGMVTDPTGPASGSSRVNRGGSWFNSAEFCRSAYRSGDSPSLRSSDYGFRVSLSPSGQ